MVELRERERGAQAQAARALVLGDGDGRPERLLGGSAIGRIAPEEDFAFAAKEEGIFPMFACFFGER
ncbi:MAG: hypothetical protein JO288_11635 [Hyphomicrobiales bacterium]|nr:hypothetical protein [Hyphomicrobiales bacterium]